MTGLAAQIGSASEELKARLARMDWTTIFQDLEAGGNAVLPALLSPEDCADTRERYARDVDFRSHVIMARHGFGRGEYKYFACPLPPLIGHLRTSLYGCLAPVANRWNEALGTQITYPAEHQDFLDRCHQAGQSNPTPLLLQYQAGDYNCLHQDVYGEQVFPLQVAILLSQPGEDFEGGEFVMTEQRPRMQSRVEVVPLTRGDAVVFTVRERPVRGTRGTYRVHLRHGVSRVRSGLRYTLGIIFHDAR